MSRKRLSIYDDFSAAEIDKAINSWIHSERNRKILHYKLVDNYTYEYIAEIMNMSPRRIQDIIYNSEDKVYRHLRA